MEPAYSTVRPHRDPAAIRLEHDAAILVGAVQLEPRAVAEGRERRGRWVPVVVVATTGDDGDGRPQLSQLGGQSGIGGAVVGDLEDLDVPRDERRGDVRLRVGGQE